ncbi:MAG: class I tRNA ligase family protein, partial [Bacteroidia bacterium]
AHDERDFKFANYFKLPVIKVIEPNKEHSFEDASWDEKEGTLINSDFLNDLDVKSAIKKAIVEIERRQLGKGKVNFRLRDAVFGRQRYWGEPIPIFYKDGIPHALPDSELPLILPEVDKYLPTEDGEPPLARAKDWKYKGEYDYEHTTMPGWAGSSWYFLRYMDPGNSKAPFDNAMAAYWKEVDLYIGGSEHATGHLLYVRFWTKFLKDLGYISIEEPAQKLINQGMIQGRSNFVYRLELNNHGLDSSIQKNIFISKDILDLLIKSNCSCPEYDDIVVKIKEKYNIDIDFKKNGLNFTKINVDVNIVNNDVLDIENFKLWRPEIKEALFGFNSNGEYICGAEVEKMSKSKWNVVSPDDICERFGADTLRLYEMFLGPLEQSKPWNTNGITGVHGFLKKLWRLFHGQQPSQVFADAGEVKAADLFVSNEDPTKAELKSLHKTIKKITEDIDRFSFNTSVSNFMICVNELTELKCNKRAILEPLLVILSPYAPHIAEELWSQLGHKESISAVPFPVCNEAYLQEDNFSYPVSFNGKMRFQLELPVTLPTQDIEKMVMEHELTKKYLEGKTPKKVIIVPKKIVNIVV